MKKSIIYNLLAASNLLLSLSGCGWLFPSESESEKKEKKEREAKSKIKSALEKLKDVSSDIPETKEKLDKFDKEVFQPIHKVSLLEYKAPEGSASDVKKIDNKNLILENNQDKVSQPNTLSLLNMGRNIQNLVLQQNNNLLPYIEGAHRALEAVRFAITLIQSEFPDYVKEAFEKLDPSSKSFMMQPPGTIIKLCKNLPAGFFQKDMYPFTSVVFRQ